MSKNVTIAGTNYSNVPSVDLPKIGGGTASFFDVSDTTRSASDVANGKYFYTSAGVRTAGTGTGGGGSGIESVTQDRNGYVVLDNDEGNQILIEELNVTANGTYTAAVGHAYTPVTVYLRDAEPEEKAVNFYDYDGVRLYSYTAREFALLADLPEVPNHTGWAQNRWNWTKQQITTQLTVSGGVVNVGRIYGTNNTEIDITLTNKLSPTLMLGVNGTVKIHWGDGQSSISTLTGNDTSTSYFIRHTYPRSGDYTITIRGEPSSQYLFRGTGSANRGLLVESQANQTSTIYSSCVNAVRIGATYTKGIGNYAFSMCYNLKYVLIPYKVDWTTSIGQYAFSQCSKLKHVNLPETITSIGQGAFYRCYSLKGISAPQAVVTEGASCFYNCYSLPSITIPSAITALSDSIHYNNSSLKSVYLSPYITSIGLNAFNNCYNLENIVFQEGLTTIGQGAFSINKSLKEITIPSTVTSIGTNAFSNCSSLEAVHLLSASPPTLSNTPFNSVSSQCVFYVPQGKLNDYQTAQYWSNYASQMVEES